MAAILSGGDELTHWGMDINTYVGEWDTIASGNGLLATRH